MRFRLALTKSAGKDYENILDSKLRRGVNRVLDQLKENPYRFKKLAGPLSHLWEAKTFSFRILYEINGKILVVSVISIEHRKDSYR